MDIEQILNYKITRKLGIGGHISLFAAEQTDNPENKVVVSVYDELMAKNPAIVQRFNEIMPIVKTIDHKNVVKILEYMLTENYFATIAEILPGQNLQFIILIRGLSRTAILEVFTEILKTVDFVHKKGLVHNNFKPSNIIVPDKFSDLKIIDFGFADILFKDNPELIKEFIFESPMFMSPEFVTGQKVTCKSDIYSLGVLFYFMFSHKPPYLKTAPNNVILEHIKNDLIPEIKGYGKINDIIAKATAKNPDNRYEDCQAFLKDISTL